MASKKKLTNRELMDNYFAKSRTVGQPDSSVVIPKAPGDSSASIVAVVRNIPTAMHSKELRKYFSDYTENGKFRCFHYRHRPELQSVSEPGKNGTNVDSDASRKSTTCCCMISFSTVKDRSDFIRDYHGRHWMNNEGMEVPRRCFITAIKVVMPTDASGHDSVSQADVNDMIEFRPPQVMPNGNVGTPSEYFLEQIRLCRLPSSLIPKLGLKTGRRPRKFESVPFKYSEEAWAGDGKEELESFEMPDDSLRREKFEQNFEEEAMTLQETTTPVDPTDVALQRDFAPDNDHAPHETDDDQCEEWERHEALHEDVTEQDRAKPRKYEEEMEVVWEKGGPGLVWYTDKNYWDEREKGTDCDWAWADDWDVDYSVYYEGKSAGTIDSRQAVEIREDEQRRKGKLEESAFSRKPTKVKGEAAGRKRRHSGSDVVDIEQYSKGVASKLLGKMGWRPGTGLGRSEQGRVLPVSVELEEEGQSGREKKGFGYRGEKLQRWGLERREERHAIATCFDKTTDKGFSLDRRVVEDDDSSQILFRRHEPTTMKYR